MLGRILFLALFLFSAVVYADQKENEIPSGVEKIKVTEGYYLLLPKGLKYRKIGAQILIEDDGNFVGRRIDDFKVEINSLKEENINLKKDLASQAETLLALKKDLENQAKSLASLKEATDSLRGLVTLSSEKKKQ